jgi:hypothetical protein
MLNAKLLLTTSFQDEDVTPPDAEQQDKPKTAFDKLMDRQSSTAVRTSSKLPLILQVCSLGRGHSEAEVDRRLIALSAVSILATRERLWVMRSMRRGARTYCCSIQAG